MIHVFRLLATLVKTQNTLNERPRDSSVVPIKWLYHLQTEAVEPILYFKVHMKRKKAPPFFSCISKFELLCIIVAKNEDRSSMGTFLFIG